ncbi:hypothetical protein CYMTET_31323 [Cymbomonas tetramitiformis]|uniref:Uncharacterized protein n=1 Tax=Cymbomonas tetramitiformis TaxID=36881 RepID=A0AAE0FHE0_9CHLO|nr:hypothetical protein CYMTET_31323 [Cymbomonas tetramitiformis]
MGSGTKIRGVLNCTARQLCLGERLDGVTGLEQTAQQILEKLEENRTAHRHSYQERKSENANLIALRHKLGVDRLGPRGMKFVDPDRRIYEHAVDLFWKRFVGMYMSLGIRVHCELPLNSTLSPTTHVTTVPTTTPSVTFETVPPTLAPTAKYITNSKREHGKPDVAHWSEHASESDEAWMKRNNLNEDQAAQMPGIRLHHHGPDVMT